MAAAPPGQAEGTATAAADGPAFEGEVDLRITSAKADKQALKTGKQLEAGKKPAAGKEGKADKDAKHAAPIVRLQVKGKKLRFALPEGFEGGGPQIDPKGYVVIDGAEKKLLAVSDEKRQVVIIPLDKVSEQMTQLGKAAAPEGEVKPGTKPAELKKTGKTDTVAGRSCEEWEITSGDKTKLLMCVSNEHASWLQLPTLGLPSEHSWARQLMDGQHLPLRAISLEPSGKEKGRIELLRLEAKTLDDALFAVPADYKVIDLGEMMRGMATMLGGATPPGVGGQGAMPPGMAGKLPPNFQAMMARMRDQMKAMKAQQGGAATDTTGATPGTRSERAEKLAAPAEADYAPSAAAKAKAKAKAKQAASTAPSE